MILRILGVAVCTSLFLAGCGVEEVALEEQATAMLPACDPDSGGLVLPDGFCALVVADNIGRPRHIDVTADGDIYVHNRGIRIAESNEPAGGIIALRDADDDGRAEIVEHFSEHYGTGLQLRGDYLYASTTTEVYRYLMTPGELVPRGEPELIVSGFPEQRGHAEESVRVRRCRAYLCKCGCTVQHLHGNSLEHQGRLVNNRVLSLSVRQAFGASTRTKWDRLRGQTDTSTSEGHATSWESRGTLAHGLSTLGSTAVMPLRRCSIRTSTTKRVPSSRPRSCSG